MQAANKDALGKSLFFFLFFPSMFLVDSLSGGQIRDRQSFLVRPSALISQEERDPPKKRFCVTFSPRSRINDKTRVGKKWGSISEDEKMENISTSYFSRKFLSLPFKFLPLFFHGIHAYTQPLYSRTLPPFFFPCALVRALQTEWKLFLCAYLFSEKKQGKN